MIQPRQARELALHNGLNVFYLSTRSIQNKIDDIAFFSQN